MIVLHFVLLKQCSSLNNNWMEYYGVVISIFHVLAKKLPKTANDTVYIAKICENGALWQYLA
jgi:hypothetical protein